MIRTLIADDHTIFRKGLKQIADETHDILVEGEASSGMETLNEAFKKDYDVVVLDISLPDRNGLDILKELKSRKPKLKVMILSMHPEEQYAVRAIRSGAAGYLTKESTPDQFVTALRRVALGGNYFSSSLAGKLAFELGTDAERPLHHALSNREYEVMLMIASGKMLMEIARKLCLSVKTVSTYRSRVLLKMKSNNNAELIRYCLENKLLD